MFGFYRFYLALMVVITHLGKIEVLGGEGVWGFFMLSGFLITGVLNTRYGFTKWGLVEFFLGRALRLFPTYWVTIVITSIVYLSFSDFIPLTIVNRRFGWPTLLHEQLSSLILFGQSIIGLGRVNFSLSPSAWAVEIEIMLYVISCFWASRNLKNAEKTLLFCASIFPLLWFAGKNNLIQEFSGQITYSFILAALLPYSIGCYLWYKRFKFERFTSPKYIPISLALIVLTGIYISKLSITGAYIFALPFLAFSTLSFSFLKLDSFHNLMKLDKFLGYMSYPIYLTHWLGAYLFVLLFQGYGSLVTFHDGLMRFTILGFIVVTIFILLISTLNAYYLEMPLENRRRAIAKKISDFMNRRGK
jgi:peptidoglycan/LPS O-acetylase OafA/YrhL